ncbi:transposase [Agrilutibacter solisilvae]|uniref:Transposase n=1 Tax=Agrilutibacter solisilvae TaxID=2763317 RepID=A0A975AT73_9GAMM|nr:transposase [Lysobacter solisilvae]QSX79729.1 transposase [Lysobacter solisilvae]
MPRPPRPDIAGIPQHIVQRGNDRQPCFYRDDDYLAYLALLHEACLKHPCAVHAYVLMTNHVHLLLTPAAEKAGSRVMQTLGRNYVTYINARYRRSGALWEGRYKSCLVDSQEYALACYRYIELNPVRAGMVQSPADYRWSSHRCNAWGEPDRLIRPHPEYLALGPQGPGLHEAYRALFDSELASGRAEEIRQYTQQQKALGTARFQARIEAILGRPLQVRPAHRPCKAGHRGAIDNGL